jgi:hypothetical protein
MTNRLPQIVAFMTAAIALLSFGVNADTPLPTINEPHGEDVKCVQPEDEMRRNHMNYILHQRDETMHEGIRTERYSLANCIDCHVEPDKDGNIATIDSEEHFCHGCHEYAAVNIDCFECHADRPQKYIKRSKTAALQQQLQNVLAKDDQQAGLK